MARGRRACGSYVLLLAAGFLVPGPVEAEGRVLRVPVDFGLIGAAVAAAGEGDTVLVDDGFYYEKNLVLDKRITLRSRRLFGAVIVGSEEDGTATFIVRAPVEIEGFIFKGGHHAIRQRDSPDVEWRGRDLAFLGVRRAVSLDDRETTIGSASLSNLIIDGAETGLATNDAGSLEVRRLLVTRTGYALGGSNHRRFRVDDAVLLSCGATLAIDHHLNPTAARSFIEAGPNFDVFPGFGLGADGPGLKKRLGTLFFDEIEAPDAADRTRRRDSLMALLLAETLADAGRWEAAFHHFRQALSTALACGLAEVRWRADFGLARAADALGDPTTAVEYYKRTVDVIEASGLSLTLTNLRAGYFRDKAPVYERLIGLLVRAHFRRPQEGASEEALAYIERAGSRSPAASRAGESPASRVLRAEVDRINASISGLQIRLQDERLPAAERKAFLEKLAVAESRHWDLSVRAGMSDPRPAAAPGRASLKPGWAREAVPNDATAAVRFFVGQENSFAFLVTRSGVEVVTLPGEAEIRGLVERYSRFLTLRDGEEFKGWEGGARLARLLLGPFLARLGSGVRELVVIPDGALHYLPFEALVRDRDSGRFLIEDYAIRYAPSLSQMIQAAREPGRSDWELDFAGIACVKPVAAVRQTGATILRLPPLRGAAAEIRGAAAFFPPGRSTLLEAGGEADFKALPLADFRVIHIAAHGLIDDRNWWRSALLLGRRPRDGEDGLLQPREIFPLRLRADLVVLSGCETGYGPLERGEGVLGLSLAFLSAGARSLLLSLWSVEDLATAGLMDRFYRNWRDGASKSQSLRQAKLEALRSKLCHPLYWAGLVLSGD